MHILTTLAPIDAPHGSAVALGFFDGVHLGHRAVLGAAVDYAAAHGLTAAAFTFSLPADHPLKGGRIFPDREKHRRVAELGITEYQEAPFADFCALSPEDFVRKVLVGCFAARAVFCGDNFTFGAKAAGNVALLQALCAAQGIETHVVEMAQYQGQVVSSTRIRAALEDCRIQDANAMLGPALRHRLAGGPRQACGHLPAGHPHHQPELPRRRAGAGLRRLSHPHPAGRPLVSFGHRHRPPPHRGRGRRAHHLRDLRAGFLRRRLRPAPPAGVPPVSLPHPQV